MIRLLLKKLRTLSFYIQIFENDRNFLIIISLFDQIKFLNYALLRELSIYIFHDAKSNLLAKLKILMITITFAQFLLKLFDKRF